MEHNQQPRNSFYNSIEKEQCQKLRPLRVLGVIVAVLIGIIIAIVLLSRIFNASHKQQLSINTYQIPEIPEYEGEVYCILNNNIPTFDTSIEDVFEQYGELDTFGRCTVAFANICREIMPTEERGEIGQVKPSGWKQEKYPGIVDSEPAYLYNRCHLIGYQLSGENANENNLITGTRYFNVEGMLPFENLVREYIDDTGNHVLYRVTPIFVDKNLVASGVVMEAWSVEDDGKGICFNVFIHNIQPGITIDYSTGESWVTE